jgi:predicted MPP superfamily phosphohydrolase
MISRRHFMTLGYASAVAGIAGAGDAFGVEPRFRLVTAEWGVRHPGWTGAPLRIGILADLHAVEPWMPLPRIASIVERLNACRPDVIVLLGDYVNALRSPYYTTIVPVPRWADALAALRAPLGVYAILGNHDWWSGEVPAIREAFARAGIRLLENAAVPLAWDGGHFWMAGLGDQLAYRRKGGADDLPGTLRQIGDKAPAILLAHEPDIFQDVPARVTLTLAGHTHGGQVYIPFVGRPATDENYGRYAYGHIEEEGRHMIVSSGLGLSHLPVRFLVPPEIALVTLSGLA